MNQRNTLTPNHIRAEVHLTKQSGSESLKKRTHAPSPIEDVEERRSSTDILSTQAQAPTDYPVDQQEYADIDGDDAYFNENAQPGDCHILQDDQIPEEVEKQLSVMMRMINAHGVELAQLQTREQSSRQIDILSKKIESMAKEIESLQKLMLLQHSSLVQSKEVAEPRYSEAHASNAFISQTEPTRSAEYSIKLDDTKTTEISPNEAFVSETNATTELETSIQIKKLRMAEKNNEAEPTPHVLEASNEVNEPEMSETESDTDDLKPGLLYSSSIEYGRPPRIDHNMIGGFAGIETPREDEEDEQVTEPTANLSGIYGGRDIIAPANQAEENAAVDMLCVSYEIVPQTGKIIVLFDDQKCEVELCQENFLFDVDGLQIRIGGRDASYLIECQTPLEFRLRTDQIRKALSSGFRVFDLRIRETERQLLADGVAHQIQDMHIGLQLIENGLYRLIFQRGSQTLFHAVMREGDAEAFVLRACELGAMLL